jgi:hypothetical protein
MGLQKCEREMELVVTAEYLLKVSLAASHSTFHQTMKEGLGYE